MKKLPLNRRRNGRSKVLVVILYEAPKENVEIRKNGNLNPKRIIGGPGCSMI